MHLFDLVHFYADCSLPCTELHSWLHWEVDDVDDCNMYLDLPILNLTLCLVCTVRCAVQNNFGHGCFVYSFWTWSGCFFFLIITRWICIIYLYCRGLRCAVASSFLLYRLIDIKVDIYINQSYNIYINIVIIVDVYSYHDSDVRSECNNENYYQNERKKTIFN